MQSSKWEKGRVEKQRFSSTASVLCLYASGVEVEEERLKRQKKVSIINESWRKGSALHRGSIVFFSDMGRKKVSVSGL